MYCSLVVKGRVVPRENGQSHVDINRRYQQAGGPSFDVGLELAGHSGEDRVGPAPTSRFRIGVASVTADHEAAQRGVVVTPDP
jgi:hypothetical protein